MLDRRKNPGPLPLIPDFATMRFPFPPLLWILSMAVGAWLGSCTNKLSEIKAFERAENLPVLKVDTLEVLYSDSAKLKIKLATNKLLRFAGYEKPYMEFPEGLKVYFYNANQKLESSLVADYALFNEKSEIWEARGNVVIVNREGEVITTPELFWDRKKQKLYSDKEVRIRTRDEILLGTGFDADQNFSRYTIWKLSGVLNVDTEQNAGPVVD